MNGRKANSSNTGPASESKLVLVVLEDAASLACVSILLGRFGYKAIKAATGREALAAFKKTTPSLAMVSPDLTDCSGFDVMQQLRQNAATTAVPLIGILKKNSREQQGRCSELGADVHVYEPFDAERLYASVQAAMEKKPRSHIRVRTVLPVKVHSLQHDSLYGAYTLGLSSGGMFLRTMNPVAVNSEISLEFDLNGRSIVAETVVLYNCQAGCGPDRETGVGLRFTHMSPRDRDAVRDYIHAEIMTGIPSQ